MHTTWGKKNIYCKPKEIKFVCEMKICALGCKICLKSKSFFFALEHHSSKYCTCFSEEDNYFFVYFYKVYVFPPKDQMKKYGFLTLKKSWKDGTGLEEKLERMAQQPTPTHGGE